MEVGGKKVDWLKAKEPGKSKSHSADQIGSTQRTSRISRRLLSFCAISRYVAVARRIISIEIEIIFCLDRYGGRWQGETRFNRSVFRREL